MKKFAAFLAVGIVAVVGLVSTVLPDIAVVGGVLGGLLILARLGSDSKDSFPNEVLQKSRIILAEKLKEDFPQFNESIIGIQESITKIPNHESIKSSLLNIRGNSMPTLNVNNLNQI
ncbi:hypothetical protein GW796_07555 [archaeon]|nr:hypothetical protein [archaeon]